MAVGSTTRRAGRNTLERAWDGYPPAKRIADAFSARAGPNPVVLTGDRHSKCVNDIRVDFDQPESPVVATEFVGTSISTNGDTGLRAVLRADDPFNPHIKFFDGDRRGYLRCQFDKDQMRTDLQMVTTVSRADAPATTFASFVVQDGVPGAVRV